MVKSPTLRSFAQNSHASNFLTAAAFALKAQPVDSEPTVKTSGLELAHVIDVIAHDPQTDEVALIMHEPRAWTGSDAQLFQLQEKINTYLAFALDGEMAETYPAFAAKTVRLQLDCAEPPDARALEFISMVREQIAFQGIKFEIRVTGQAPCGSGCSCEA
jgi:hypothetical protein